MAQLGSAPALGAGGPRFESGHPDQSRYGSTLVGVSGPGGADNFAISSS